MVGWCVKTNSELNGDPVNISGRRVYKLRESLSLT